MRKTPVNLRLVRNAELINDPSKNVYDLVRTSPTKSDPSVSQYELSILGAIDGLEMAASKKELQMVRDYAAQIINSANERKQRLRLVQ